MKKIVFILLISVIPVCSFGQVPEGFNYQAILRDGSGIEISNQDVAMQISILKVDEPVYVETFKVTTNKFGLVNLVIGSGEPVDGKFGDIDWSGGNYFMKVELDVKGGTDFIEIGTTQLMSVPYALYSQRSLDAFTGNYNDLANLPGKNVSDTTYWVYLDQNDEDYINFGTFENFTNSSDWSVIEKVKMPAGTGATGGWHFFRGKAWLDKTGDIALQITTSSVYGWVQSGGWQDVAYNSTFTEDTWYILCLQYDAAANTLSLYVDGNKVDEQTGVAPQDDSGNTNNLFWGGQDVDPSRGQGDLYSEKSIVIASQDWYQRLLTDEEIANYANGEKPTDGLCFSASINATSVTDSQGSHDGINGNSPEFITGELNDHTDFGNDLFVDGNLTVTGDLKVGGDLDVGGIIKGSVEIDTIHFSQISGLLGQGYSMIFPQILDNLCTLELDGVQTTDKVVVVSSLGTETERISTYVGIHPGTGETMYSESTGLTAEFPLIFETTNSTDAQNVKTWFDYVPQYSKNAAIVIRDASGAETARWTLTDYLPDHYEEGTDGRTRFTMVHEGLPDNVNDCQYSSDFGNEHSYNPDTDKLVEISGVTNSGFTPAVEIDYTNRTITLTMDYLEGAGIYQWVKNVITGLQDKKDMSVIETTDGLTEISRRNFYGVMPIKYEHIYGFGLNTKLKARIVIAYGFWEEG